MDDNIKFYDLKAVSYAEEWYGNDMMLPSIKEFLSILSTKIPEVLDLGCGPGNESMRLQKEGATVTGIDYSSESIKEAQKRNSGITFKEMSYDEIDTTLGEFDGVFSCSSLIHLNKNSLNIVLQKINLVLRLGGVFLVIYRKGSGQIIQHHDIEGEKIIRTIEQYERETMIEIFERNGYVFLQGGYLDVKLKPSWDSLLFKKVKAVRSS